MAPLTSISRSDMTYTGTPYASTGRTVANSGNDMPCLFRWGPWGGPQMGELRVRGRRLSVCGQRHLAPSVMPQAHRARKAALASMLARHPIGGFGKPYMAQGISRWTRRSAHAHGTKPYNTTRNSVGQGAAVRWTVWLPLMVQAQLSR
jgi:hypothetical protein